MIEAGRFSRVSDKNKGRTARLGYLLLRALRMAIVCIWPCSLAVAQTSAYHPFPDSNAVWGMSSTCNYDMTCGTNAYIRDFYDGDTLIDGHVYKVVSEQYHIIDGSADCCNPDYGGGACFLRDDTVSKIVYIRFQGTMDDLVLYDFNMVTGDTVKGYFSDHDYCSFENAIVQSVDSIFIYGSYVRRINIGFVDGVTDFSFIEGVGSTNGLKTCILFANGEISIHLDCVTVDGELLYAYGNNPNILPCGELPVGMQDASIGGVAGVTPNPSAGRFTLQLPFGQAALKDLQLFTLQGRALPVEVVTHGSPGEISVSVHAPAGVYALRLRFADGSTQFAKVALRP